MLQAAANGPPSASDWLVTPTVNVSWGIEVGGRYPDLGTGRMQHRLGREDIRPTMGQLGRQGRRNFHRQAEVLEREIGRRPLGRRLAHQDRQGMARRSKLLVQRRQQGAVVRELALRGDPLGLSCRAHADRRLDETHVLAVVVDDGLHGRELGRARPPMAKSLRNDVAFQRQMRRRQLVSVVFGQAPPSARPGAGRPRTSRSGSWQWARPCRP